MAGGGPDRSNRYCLCIMHVPGLAWSESKVVGESFNTWANKFFEEGQDPLFFISDPGTSQEEFVTARSMGPGGSALVKPQIACSIQRPHSQTTRSATLAIRMVTATNGVLYNLLCCAQPPLVWD